MLNWTAESIITLVAGLPILLGVYILYRRYREHRNRIMLFLTITWLLHALYLSSFGIGYLFLNIEYLRYNSVILALNLYLFIVIFDYMTSERVEPIKVGIASIINYLLISSAFSPESVIDDMWPNGDPTYMLMGSYRVYTALVGFSIGLLYLYLSVRIILNVPPRLKNWAYLNFIGVFLFSQVVTIFFLLGLTSVIPGIANLISALGGLCALFAFYRSPQLIYALPFDAYRLHVIDYQTSNTVYSYTWLEEDGTFVSDQLFSSALSALNSFSIEAIKRGNIREITLDTGVMLVQSFPMNNLQFVLLASKGSEVLNDNLFTFARLFSQRYASQIDNSDTVLEITDFDKADDLIQRSFPYIPFSRAVAIEKSES